MRFLISVLLVVSMATTQASAEPEAIELPDLAAPAAMSFDDPSEFHRVTSCLEADVRSISLDFE